MCTVMLACLLVVAGLSTVAADPPTFRAGVTQIAVQDGEPFDAIVWYPTEAVETPWRSGPYPIAVTRNADIADGTRFPLLLLSHGSGGSPFGHRELAAHLARRGFIVVAPTHVGDSTGGSWAAKRGAPCGIARARPARRSTRR